MMLSLDSIVMGHRVRKDMGDIDVLAASITQHGLLHPIVVKPDRNLIAGQRRIEAFRKLGRKEIPATVIDVGSLLAAERDENEVRKDFTPSEAIAIGRLIEAQDKPNALKRMLKGASGKLPEARGQARDKAARAVGMSGRTYERAKAVVNAAESEPARFGDLVSKMDESGNVSGTHRELRRRVAVSPSTIGAPLARKTVRGRSRDDMIGRAYRERLVSLVSTGNGLRAGIESLKFNLLAPHCTDGEFKKWRGDAVKNARAFSSLARQLKRGPHGTRKV